MPLYVQSQKFAKEGNQVDLNDENYLLIRPSIFHLYVDATCAHMHRQACQSLLFILPI